MKQQDLEELIIKHQNLYYRGEPEVSDEEFDSLWDTLKQQYPESSLLKEVGKETSSGVKVEHVMLMGSQDKVNNPEDFKKWISKESIEFPVWVQTKADGISVEMVYEGGKFVRATTRGDGYFGEYISEAVSKMKGVPSAIEETFYGAVRGEILIEDSVFKSKYSKDFKNPRNFVAGAVKNSAFSNYSDLVVISYDVYRPSDLFKTEDEKLCFLSKNGFRCVEGEKVSSAEKVIDKWNRENQNSYTYAIDGLVVKQSLIDKEDLKRLRPKKQRAFKWQDEGVVTTLEGIEWSRSGQTFTPVALLTPIEIEGSVVSRASLANPSLIRDLGLKIGDDVLVTKRGMIIPKIEKVVSRSPEGREIELPSLCPICGSALVLEEKSLSCKNPECLGRAEHRIEKWIEVLDAKGFGDSFISYLSSNGFTRIEDLYDLNKIGAQREDFGSVNWDKAFRDLHSKSKEIPVEKFFAGWDIEGLGEEIFKSLVEAGFDTEEKILNLTREDLERIPGFGETRINTLLSEMKKLRPEIESLLESNLISIKRGRSLPVEGSLKGKHICVTGKLEGYSRKEIESLIKDNGGIADSSVTSKTDILVTNEPASGSSKLKAAAKYGTKIISEREFIDLI